jgi:hypothetical protein
MKNKKAFFSPCQWVRFCAKLSLCVFLFLMSLGIVDCNVRMIKHRYKTVKDTDEKAIVDVQKKETTENSYTGINYNPLQK